ncbi:MAG TPA: hypothetical protein VE641_07695 [Chthoniobacterales bacterium]|nr:hypothetical protein [Chthoniobacterales bacterium]
MKIRLLFLLLFLSVAGVSQAGGVRGGAGGVRGGFGGHGFHAGFGARGLNSAGFRGGGFNRGGFNRDRFDRDRFNRDGFRGRFVARRNRPIFFQQFGWPVYWYPWYTYDDLNYSDLQPDPPDYQYWDNSASLQQSPAYVRQESTNPAVPQNPVVIVINAANSRPTDSGGPTDPRGNVGYANYGYVPTGVSGPQRTVGQDPNERTGPDPVTPGDPVTPQATPVPLKNTQSPVRTGPFGKYVVVSYLQDRGKDVVSVKNVETNDVQRITSQPNIDHLRLVEVHPNPDLRQFEAIISNGSDQGAVRFQF